MNRLLAAVCIASLFGCASGREVPLPRTAPPTTAEMFHFQEAVDLSSAAASAAGYPTSEVKSLEQVQPNYWRVRFGVAPKGSGRFVDVYFDGQRREVVKTEEVLDVKLTGQQP